MMWPIWGLGNNGTKNSAKGRGLGSNGTESRVKSPPTKSPAAPDGLLPSPHPRKKSCGRAINLALISLSGFLAVFGAVLGSSARC